MDLGFLLGLGLMGGGYGYEREYNPWAYGMNEKSAAATRRENEAKSKFTYLKGQMNLALYENTMTTISMGRLSKPNNKSPLKLLSGDVLKQVLEYAGIKPKKKDVKEAVAGRGSGTLAIVPFVGYEKNGRGFQDETGLNLADPNLLLPGSKICFPLTKPNLHLTGPCYRDLRKHVKANPNWDIKRTEATPAQKKQYKETRKGKVYFINAIYKVPGKSSGKRKQRTSISSSNSGAEEEGTRKHGQRKSPPELLPKEPPKFGLKNKVPVKDELLKACIQSAAADAGGNVDPKLLARAIGAGYSKYFVLGKVEEHLESIKDTKPPAAKKAKTDEQLI